MLIPARMRLLVSSLALSTLACSGSPSSSTWTISRAENHFANGKLELALRYAEQAIQRNPKHPHEREISLLLKTLRELDRSVEAEAFQDFAERYESGAYTYSDETTPSRKECKKPQPGYELVSSWGNFGTLKRHGDYDVGTIAATFEVDYEGNIGKIGVLRAKHPAAAWLVITSIARSKITRSRLDKYREDFADAFPVSLCAWWNYDEIKNVLPRDRRIRGVR